MVGRLPEAWHALRTFFSRAVLGLLMASMPAAVAADEVPLEPGIPAALAEARSARISNLRYELTFRVPRAQTAPVTGRAILRFELADASSPLVLDFDGTSDLQRSSANGTPFDGRLRNGHVIVPAASLRPGGNTLDLEFVSHDGPLNRNPDFLYSLFVPARAHQAFPCFDQPDLKARFRLTLDLPGGWRAVANGAEMARTVNGDRVRMTFAETEPLSTYVFAFAAGVFEIETAERGGRPLRMFHRETDLAKVARNREAIFDLHGEALAWLERYTGLPYAFGKLDFVLIPSFQFGGMEHAGAIFYNANSLLLEETATQNQRLGRASLIAHEAAHMWFGNLVTMRWFDDVWLKEVFANLMAAKIVNPSFPGIDHDLRFFLAHYPAAYEVDRSAGTNPIRQHLDNLADAGSLYGAIIYQKAPIVMRQLERVLGVEPFRLGLQAYLRTYAFGNATWEDLIAILDTRTGEDLAAWSRAWVDEPGRPVIRAALTLDPGGRIARLLLTQEDRAGRGLHWRQHVQVDVKGTWGARRLPAYLDGHRAAVPDAEGLPAPAFVLAGGGGLGYGYFELDRDTREYLLEYLPAIDDALSRGVAWVTLWEAMLEGELAPLELIHLMIRALPLEHDELNLQRVLAYLNTAFWRYAQPPDRERLAPRLEATLRDGLAAAHTTSLKAAWFSTFRDTVLTPGGVSWLESVWRRETIVPGLVFSEIDETAMALELAVREVAAWREILEVQRERITNPDRRARFEFVMPALSADPDVRERFFVSLREPSNRRQEPWVLEGLSYLHHPLRAERSRRHLAEALELLPDIRRTGDIFFPKRWLDATLRGHNSPEAAAIVRRFLERGEDHPERLVRIVLQSADELFRASRILAEPVG